MKGAQLAFYLALGFVFRSVLLFFWGNGGLADYGKVSEYKELLQANIEELKGINDGLRRELESLSSDPERVVLQARELGYFRPQERVFRIAGRQQEGSYYALGKLLRAAPQPEHKDWLLKLAGLAIPVVLYLFGLFRKRRKGHENRGS